MTTGGGTSGSRPFRRGRALAVIGIVLVAFSLRSAVTSLSPVVAQIAHDFPMPSAVVGLIGTAPPVCYAVFGLITPFLERRLGLERLAVLSLVVITAGLAARGAATDSVTLLLSTALVFAGVGMGNILMPPLVKKHFPDRLGLMMTLYSTMMAVATFVPPLIAVPVADAAGWRTSLALWAVFALAGAAPWIAMLVRERGGAGAASGSADVPSTGSGDGAEDRATGSGAGAGYGPATGSGTGAGYVPSTGSGTGVRAEDRALSRGSFQDAASVSTGPIPTAPTSTRALARLLRIPLAWALTLVFGTSASMAYTAFAWLPSIMIEQVGVDAKTAGFLLSLFAFTGLPASLIVPVLVVRFRATTPLYLFGAIGAVGGLLGLLLLPLPSVTWIWVLLYGLAGLLFPLTLVLLSIRARETETAVALSGFVQSLGYLLSAVFPVLLGVMHTATGGWQVPLAILIVLLVVSVPAGVYAGRPLTVEAAWERRHGRW
ncbi:CynX/NimT family MFS transporter [Microbacterium sp. ASV81]|uniref:MFS transporter n=1 Tax=Microbacterium capsulatum TaxID=3041921 RepID=A0ABU0XNK7_9MICO|nr:MFS transporter [Microbacterium sp. ASV81]MDQ4215330.1 MFS transporter [Microbacterium sp. ASV81]